MPTLGLQCPKTLFNLSVLGFAVPPLPRSTLVVPLWCLVGVQAAFTLGVQADLSLVIAGFLVKAR